MSLKRAVSTVNVRVDEFDLGIKAGTLTYDDGNPKRQVAGLDNGDVVASESLEEAVGKINFEVPNTAENIKNMRTVERRPVVTVRFFDDDGTERVMTQGVSLNDTEKTIGSDGSIPMNFSGTPLT